MPAMVGTRAGGVKARRLPTRRVVTGRFVRSQINTGVSTADRTGMLVSGKRRFLEGLPFMPNQG
jgi:hypothetical protein